jgi:GTP-binding protein HflX
VTGGAPVGIGTRGPGEQQLEIDRRLVQNRLSHLKDELEEIQERKTREVAQRNQSHFTVGLVGYTNAGKSTLFNRLTAGGAFADPKLFATLSTRIERWDAGGGNALMLSDTVGFIRDLPHDLVAAFRATLKEAVDADLLLHVVDASQVNRADQIAAVDAVLSEIGADAVPQVLVLNKCDATALAPDVERDEYGKIRAVRLSALTGAGVPELHAALAERFPRRAREIPCRAATA